VYYFHFLIKVKAKNNLHLIIIYKKREKGDKRGREQEAEERRFLFSIQCFFLVI